MQEFPPTPETLPAVGSQKENERLYRTEAVIIKRINIGEADKILTLYTPSRGKIRAIAKGVRRVTSHLGGYVQLYTQTRLLIAAGRNLDIVTQSQPINFFPNLVEDLNRQNHANYVIELLDKLTEDGNPNYPVYALAVEALTVLNAGVNPDTVLRGYELHLLGATGYRPQLQKCVRCEGALQPVKNYFSPEAGGVLCPECAQGERRTLDISVDALKVLRHLQKTSFANTPKLRLKPELRSEMEIILRSFIYYILERDLKSVEFIHNLI